MFRGAWHGGGLSRVTTVVELNIQVDHIHLLVMVPPKISISDFVGMLKGRLAIGVLNKLKELKCRPYWGNHFWTRGYCVVMPLSAI
ncbi:MAG TPA: IS200/IS605 family transposase [Gammaproteobacteria bacterium]|nr:IS200/IS605 family transposase [Gammaproteobacteria bacterium]